MMPGAPRFHLRAKRGARSFHVHLSCPAHQAGHATCGMMNSRTPMAAKACPAPSRCCAAAVRGRDVGMASCAGRREASVSEPTAGTALGLVYNITTQTLELGTAQPCGFAGFEVMSGWCHDGVTLPAETRYHGQNTHDSAPAPRPGQRRRGGRPGTGNQPQCLHRAGRAQLGELPAQTTGHRPASLDVSNGATAYGGKASAGRKGRTESALPVRQRPKVQAVSRQTGHLIADGSARKRGPEKVRALPASKQYKARCCFSTTGAQGPEGIMP